MRVVITGMGCVTPVGNSPEEVFAATVEGRSGIRRVTLFPLDESHPCEVAGEVDFQLSWLDRILHRELKRIARATQFAMFATSKALNDSQLEYRKLPPEKAQRIGVCMGASLIGMADVIEQVDKYRVSGARWISAQLIQKIMPNAAAARPSMHEGIHGPVFTTSAACASSAISVIHLK